MAVPPSPEGGAGATSPSRRPPGREELFPRSVIAHTGRVTSAPTTLVPPRRLGTLLAETRHAAGRSLPDLVARAGGRFTEDELRRIEDGSRPLEDDEVRALTALYGVDAGELVPERSHLVIDLDEAAIVAGDHRELLRAPTADEVLATYLSLLYTMRHTAPGSQVDLRANDLDVLSRALGAPVAEVEARLVALMATPAREVTRRSALLRSRVVVPLAGIVIGVTAAGAVVLVQQTSVGGRVDLLPPHTQTLQPDGSVTAS